MRHQELHRTDRIGWLRAAVLGANDGIVSTASLIVGVAAAETTHSNVLIAGVAGLVAGAMSMAAGEYVSVSSQADTEKADLARESNELATRPDFELAELASIYVARGLDEHRSEKPFSESRSGVHWQWSRQQPSAHCSRSPSSPTRAQPLALVGSPTSEPTCEPPRRKPRAMAINHAPIQSCCTAEQEP
jgi:hypothetical protein